jgi:16S rRNA (adenine1518-N6/adenine1519-N6)-dimethyltransferase
MSSQAKNLSHTKFMSKIHLKLDQVQKIKSNKNLVWDLLKKYKISPKRWLGQNFLISKNVLRKIVETAEISKKDTILEIGPGIGNLTIELAKRAKKVIAVEKDKRMIEILKENLKDFKNVKIVQGDILKLEPRSYTLKTYKVVANIPYYLTSRLIRKFLESEAKPKSMVLMVQKEVAQRICAKPPKMNLLAVSVQFYAKPKIISFVPKNCFWPKPKVDSAILKISNLKTRNSKLKELFFKIVKAGFSQPRKQLINNLSKGLKIKKEKIKKWLLKNGVKPEKRAENLTVNEWLKLTKSFKIL